MTRVGGPLIDVAALTSWERKKLYRDPTRIKLAKGIYVRERDWWSLSDRDRAIAKIVATGAGVPGAIAAGQSAALIHEMPLKGWEANTPLEFGMFGATTGKRRDWTFRHITIHQTLNAVFVETEFGKVQVTTAAATGLDLARWHDLSLGVRGLDHALREKLATKNDIDGALRRAYGQHGVADMRNAALLATPWSESPRESDMKVALWKEGLPAPLQQVNLYGANGEFLARLDFFWLHIGLGTEYDGGGKFAGEHGVPVEVAAIKDVRRQHKISNLGVLNFRVDNTSARSGRAIPDLVAMYRRVEARGLPLDQRFWKSVGGPAW